MLAPDGVKSFLMTEKMPRPFLASGRRIQEGRRKLRGSGGNRLTQRELAAAVGVAEGTVTAWENGYQRPEGENLLRLAQVLGTTPVFILEGVGETPSTVREPIVTYGTEAEFPEAEQWLQSILAKDSLRRMVRTVEGRQVIKGLRGVIADLEWPAEKKRAADRLLTDALLDDGI